MTENKVWCYLKNLEQPVSRCYEEGCADPSFMAQCLGKKPTDQPPVSQPPISQEELYAFGTPSQAKRRPAVER